MLQQCCNLLHKCEELTIYGPSAVGKRQVGVLLGCQLPGCRADLGEDRRDGMLGLNRIENHWSSWRLRLLLAVACWTATGGSQRQNLHNWSLRCRAAWMKNWSIVFISACDSAHWTDHDSQCQSSHCGVSVITDEADSPIQESLHM